MNILSKWLTKKEAANYLRLSVRSIETLIKKGLLKSHKIGGAIRLHVDEIDDCVKKNDDGGLGINNRERL